MQYIQKKIYLSPITGPRHEFVPHPRHENVALLEGHKEPPVPHENNYQPLGSTRNYQEPPGITRNPQIALYLVMSKHFFF